MRIELDIRDYSGGLKPFVQVLCRFPRKHKFMPLSAFVDTGSPTTNISLIEFNKVSLPVSSVIDKDDFKRISIGGATHQGHPLHTPVEFKFSCGDEIVALEAPSVYVYLPFGEGRRSLHNSAHLPNIIGVDFLVYHKLGLYFNPSRGTAWLSDE
ncbi:MAG: hypothetical protein PHU95_04590 [Candidatus Thermoplasmatota archaeon]|nr:hypothetical protein [Candidatus Thermoplasmatota archaeon]